MKREELRTPCYVIMESEMKKNLQILQEIRQQSGCKILLAQKAFSMYSCYPLIGEYLDGTTASGLYEAKLGKECMGKENHIFSPAYREDEFEEVLANCEHLVFNSFSQLEKFGERAANAGKSVGIRVNPECSTQGEHAIYDPCAPGSRLGILVSEFPETLPSYVEGLHFHTLCEQNADALEITLEAVEGKFGKWMKQLKWVNFGGGHHITRADYDRELLISCVRRIQDTYNVQVYLEPGEAVALNAGHLITTVEDIVHNDIAVLDVSAACHMPDVIEMPYRPPLFDSGEAKEKEYTYLLGGPTCLAGDVIGSYSFDQQLKAGDRLTFGDMAIYTTVKNNTFNGMRLPDIVWERESGECEIVKSFGYEDFKCRL
ncbi:carboxynorspermidine decarboxylase [Mediterraneibacter gnavus]|uniref:Carboxynorspermidine decarboxylase n=1 Tax=Mediterraneibacter gnavus TaxID=33038 RepID=A0A2N5NEH2_MEDGN|nr:carboxynorspermidine decarboxylase [Mediterraneibacter gnavus]PLT52514.1 carboxynorspermidine decarboxylase [Mediterraneibacter gnavus]PLT52535.1 carboxynorspermidine decarboxylase [Mediterraneibacter gnavus]